MRHFTLLNADQLLWRTTALINVDNGQYYLYSIMADSRQGSLAKCYCILQKIKAKILVTNFRRLIFYDP